MSNHISVKFLGFVYAAIPQAVFAAKLSDLAENLRKLFPRYETPSVSGIKVNVEGGSIATQHEIQGQELHMVDAEGLWGIKIGDTGISFSTSHYVPYEEAVTYVQSVMDILVEILGVTHFSRVSLRNINLFDETPASPNNFEDIKNREYWGRQNFDTLKNGFLCNGASTRHVYFSSDFLTQIQLASGVVMPGQSHIPQEEWNIWNLRGRVPVQEGTKAKLLIDISGTRFQAPVNVPEKQNNVAPYSWDLVRDSYSNLHDLVNSVYSDITTD